MEYRKSIPLDANTDYWFVELGELTRFNGSFSYAFPSLEAAQTFAESHKYVAKSLHGVDRDVSIKYPNGSVKKL